ncbi:adenylyltransferase/cytidyltransferase family protein [Congregibacter litoralis]|uniref:Glycerol-3-phosphate cytidylyltransferase n=1 Tax=Congregibacter litoralis KT71 TaxID=314285 RepID=A4A557_9GAMM|nr:adenylyltransferase/cytidyltransferase family protein [Congregibacter litoralis]EAQ98928.1 Glycerol-3-phosphate cytidylyltransferase [Congregibacter litoralis KT71]
MITVLTCGTFDLFHVGHLRLLKRALALGDRLVVGVSSDRLNFEKKNKHAVYSLNDRIEIIRSIRCVTDVFVEDRMEDKRAYIKEHKADIFVIGDDWAGKFDHLTDLCDVHYLTRTPSVSTTEIVEVIRSTEGK